ncbi:MAG: DUF401 family protein [Solobacterium sp.]|nr:DUF401 family protein [Solobacterium sp.]
MDAVALSMLKLLACFVVIMVVIGFGLRIHWAGIIASILAILLFRIPLAEVPGIITRTVFSSTMAYMMGVFYVVTFMQRLMEGRDMLHKSQLNLDHVFHNRRINATVAPILVGMLPSVAAANIAADIVDDAVGDDLTVPEKGFVTGFFRHISEAFLPTYSNIIIMSKLCGVPLSQFVIGMLPLIVLLYALGYIFYVRKVPRVWPDAAADDEQYSKWKEFLMIFVNLWPLVVVVVMILLFNVDVLIAAAIVCAVAFFVLRYKLEDLPRMLVKAFEPQMMITMIVLLIFTGFLSYTGVINQLPDFFQRFPLPPFVIFAMVWFFGNWGGGGTAILYAVTPIAFAAIPNAGWPLMVLLNSMGYASMQVAPTHICYAVIADKFHISMGQIYRKCLPVILIFIAACFGYYMILV